MKDTTLLIKEKEIKSIFENRKELALQIVEKAFEDRINEKVDLPTKISQIFNEDTQDRINCMPASLLEEKISGVKWVSVFPENPIQGIRNVTGTIILSELERGFTLSVMDGTYITGIRTAAVGAVAAKYLAKTTSDSIGFIGTGHEAQKHLEMIKKVRPEIRTCYVSSRRNESVEKFICKESTIFPDISFVNCGSDYEKATRDADIIVTATSTQSDLLKASAVKKGALYIHVGGWEDEYEVALKADKIVCDEWENVKHRAQTLSRMYKKGLLNDADIYADLGEIIVGKISGRENDDEFIYFNSVGLAFIDVAFANYVYKECKEANLGTEFSFI